MNEMIGYSLTDSKGNIGTAFLGKDMFKPINLLFR